MRTSNPIMNENIFSQGMYATGETMTVQGTVNKTFILLACLMGAAGFVWNAVMSKMSMMAYPQANNIAMTALVAGGIVGFIIAIVLVFKKEWARFLAPVYALCQGCAMGGISAMFERQYPGIVLQAVFLTMGTLFCLLTAYKTGLIRATDKFRLGIYVATGAIFILYLVSFVMSFFGVTIPFMHGSGIFSIGFSLFVVGIAALNLILDFDFIERGAQSNAPKHMEWYASFGLMVTLVWLYIEILKLLSKLRGRD